MNKRGVFGDALLLVVGLLLVAYGVLYSLLPLIGEKTTGEVTVVRRELGKAGSAIPNRYLYSIGYDIRLPDGQMASGTAKRFGNAYSAGISRGPADVWFLRAFPPVNELDCDAGLSWDKTLMAAAGILLLAIPARKLVRRGHSGTRSTGRI